MATYWVPDLPNIKGISGHLQRFILNSYLQMVPRMHDPAGIYNSLNLWSRLALFELKITNILKSSGWGLEKSELPSDGNFIAAGVFPVLLLACQVSMVCTANWPG